MIYATIYGSLLSIPLILIPIIGPLYAGIQTGKAAKVFPIAGFTTGFLSYTIGGAIWVFALFPLIGIRPEGILTGIFLFLFTGWNILCAFIAGIGGMMGSMMSYAEDAFTAGREWDEKSDIYTEEDIDRGKNTTTYVVCPSCGTTNPEDSEYCTGCGKEI